MDTKVVLFPNNDSNAIDGISETLNSFLNTKGFHAPKSNELM